MTVESPSLKSLLGKKLNPHRLGQILNSTIIKSEIRLNRGDERFTHSSVGSEERVIDPVEESLELGPKISKGMENQIFTRSKGQVQSISNVQFKTLEYKSKNHNK